MRKDLGVEMNNVWGQPCQLWDNFALSMEIRSERQENQLKYLS